MPNPYTGAPKYLNVDTTTKPPSIEITDSDAGARRIPQTAPFGAQELPKADPKHRAAWRDTIAMFLMHDAKIGPGYSESSRFLVLHDAG